MSSDKNSYEYAISVITVLQKMFKPISVSDQQNPAPRPKRSERKTPTFNNPFSVTQTRRDVIMNAVDANKKGTIIYLPDLDDKTKVSAIKPCWFKDVHILIGLYLNERANMKKSLKKVRDVRFRELAADLLIVYKIKPSDTKIQLKPGETTLNRIARTFPQVTNKVFLETKPEAFSPLKNLKRIYQSQFLANVDPDGSLFYIACVNAYEFQEKSIRSRPDTKEIEQSVRELMQDDYHTEAIRVNMCEKLELFAAGHVTPQTAQANEYCQKLWEEIKKR